MAPTTTTTSEESAGLPVPLGDPSGGVPARVPDPDPNDQPGRAKRAWRWWLGKAAIIGAKQNRVFAWLAYYFGMSTVGLWMRKQDRLDRVTRPVGDTGWHERTDPIHTDPRRARRPF